MRLVRVVCVCLLTLLGRQLAVAQGTPERSDAEPPAAVPSLGSAEETSAPSDSPAAIVPAPSLLEPPPSASSGQTVVETVLFTGEPEPQDDPLVAAELSKLGLAEGSGGGVVDTDVKLSGFADFRFSTLLVPKDSPLRGSFDPFPAFAIGNFNVYISKNLTSWLRTFGEVRFTLLPNGSPILGSPTGEYVSTIVSDYSDYNRPMRWAGIEIERLYLEAIAWRALTVRVGIFLTPYGIWNVDHGSPTIIPVARPFAIGEALFPERQTGIEVFGQFDLTAHNSVGYHATLSNGLGPVSEYRDFDANKAVGGRVYWSYDGFGQVRVGGSVFYGTDTSANEVPSLASDGKHLTYQQKIWAKSEVLALGGDVQWKYKGLVVQAEVITQQRRYVESGRVGTVNPLLGAYIAPRDHLKWGTYGLVGYRFDWFGVMPFVLVEAVDAPSELSLASQRFNAWSVGINARPVDVLALKIQYEEGTLPNDSIVGDAPVRLLMCQIAWSF